MQVVGLSRCAVGEREFAVLRGIEHHFNPVVLHLQDHEVFLLDAAAIVAGLVVNANLRHAGLDQLGKSDFRALHA